MYILDTNAFYYAAGISECTYDVQKLRNLINTNEVFIVSTTLFDFLIKHRNDLNIVHKGGKYLWEKNIKLVGNVYIIILLWQSKQRCSGCFFYAMKGVKKFDTHKGL